MLNRTVRLLNTLPHPYPVTWECGFRIRYNTEFDRIRFFLRNDPGELKTYGHQDANHDFQQRLRDIGVERLPNALYSGMRFLDYSVAPLAISKSK